MAVRSVRYRPNFMKATGSGAASGRARGVMYVIGLTGGIASGKSTVAAMLAEKGAVVLDADAAGWEVYRPEGPAYQALIDAFGLGIVAADGTIDRRKLGSRIFEDPLARQTLNSITHPHIKKLVAEKLAEQARSKSEIVVLEAALLLDAGWADLVDEVWLTVASPEVRVDRLVNEKGLSREEAEARVAAQTSNEEHLRPARVVISTDCPLEETRRMVDEEWAKLLARLPSASIRDGVANI